MVVVIFLLVARTGSDDGPAAAVETSSGDSALVRDDSRVIGEEGSSEVTVVEFLDFECEACGAAFPIIEELREKYDGEVTFVARYFPLPGHFNAERAARAVESAARQGRFEEMYQMMYETQSGWGEQQTPKDEVFRGYAEELGLDMDQFDADYASEQVAQRIQKDVEDGLKLGVQGTPTFYVDGKLLEPQSADDFHTALDEALGR
ncbi:thioredoxin domain-containing protein [Nocardioides sp. Y6]|uniref:Thioredoxin domain-containing protein n=2 Tax=Nocardioides malaquae TaxID=2773426 RepID=A0ABR9RRS1_9ACTN|nr:thioredoxin domain-containing protein [Nocardioides malaquae]